MEIRYPGLAPAPEQLQRMMDSGLSDGAPEEKEGESPQFEIRQEDYPSGSAVGFSPTLGAEVAQIVYSTHWEYQKRVLDHIEAVIASDRQWTIIRKILMNIMTEQVDRTRLLIGQKIRQEMNKTGESNDE